MKLRTGLCIVLVSAVVLPCWADVPASRAKQDKKIIKLTVAEAVIIALRNNYQINISRFNPSIAEEGVQEAWGDFDWIFGLTGNWGDDTRRTVSALAGAALLVTKELGFALQLAKKFTPGTEVEFAYNVLRTSTNSTFRIPRSWEHSLGVTIKQPLLRGGGTEFNTSQIRIAENSLKVARYALLFDAINIVSQVETAYWSLAFAQEDMKVRVESLRLAEQILRENKIKFQHGVIPELEVEGAKANVEESRENITVAWAVIRDRSDSLRNLLSMTDYNAMDEVFLEPKDRPAEVAVPKINLADEIRTALATRPDLIGKRYELANSEINIAVAKNEVYPTVDLEASYTLNGIAGNWGNSSDDMFDPRRRTVAAGLTVSVPLENRAARARHKAADLAKRQAILDLYRLEQDIITQVRTSVREVSTSQTRIKARKQSVIFAEKNLASEQRRKEAGDSTSLDVLRAKELLAAAATRLIEARVGLRIALINLQVAKGTLVTSERVYIAPLEKSIPGLPDWSGVP